MLISRIEQHPMNLSRLMHTSIELSALAPAGLMKLIITTVRSDAVFYHRRVVNNVGFGETVEWPAIWNFYESADPLAIETPVASFTSTGPGAPWVFTK